MSSEPDDQMPPGCARIVGAFYRMDGRPARGHLRIIPVPSFVLLHGRTYGGPLRVRLDEVGAVRVDLLAGDAEGLESDAPLAYRVELHLGGMLVGKRTVQPLAGQTIDLDEPDRIAARTARPMEGR